jgi:hypothetical protein
MNIEQASNFLISSILFSLAIVVLVIAITVINNIFYKYWKPIKLTYYMPGFGDNHYYNSNAESKIEPVNTETIANSTISSSSVVHTKV